jgi:hypothetical protein
VFKKFQQLMVTLAAKADARTLSENVRRVTAIGGKVMKGAGSVTALAGIGRIARQHAQETTSWITIDQFGAGKTGPFDACDLRHWLHIAELAGVDYVPAKEILRLTEQEMSIASGKVQLPDTAASRAATEGVVAAAREIIAADNEKRSAPEHEDAAEALQVIAGDIEADEAVRLSKREHVGNMLFDAMDRVPEGWMVRSSRTGPSNLKALAGSGHAGYETPEVPFGPNVEVGPGWVRIGNRRRVAPEDLRTVTAAAEGPVGPVSFLARPWVKSLRYFVHEDPHRSETPLRGPGVWPAEWRAFIEDGQVVGVSAYYSWIGEASPENALVAIEVRDTAQKLADKATDLGMWPRFMDIEFLRLSDNKHITDNPAIQEMLGHFGREKVAFTADFIETEEGLKLLEAGPPNTPFGGGHPCGFAGCGGPPKFGNKTETIGVAFRNMPHVLVGDPKTWEDGDREDCILSWDEAEVLALEFKPSTVTPLSPI